MSPVVDALDFISSQLAVIANTFAASQQECQRLVQTINCQLESDMDEEASLRLKRHLQFRTPLHFLSMINSFIQLFSVGDAQFTMNDELMKVIADTQQQKMISDFKDLDGCPSNGYINKTLDEILSNEGRSAQQLPLRIEMAIEYLYYDGCENQFIMVRANKEDAVYVKALLDRLDVADVNGFPPPVVAEALKEWARQLPGSVVAEGIASEVVNEWKTLPLMMDYETHHKAVRRLFNNIPMPNALLLRRLLKLCTKVESLSDLNQTSFTDLTHAITPSLFSEFIETHTQELSTLEDVVLFMLMNFYHLFPEEPHGVITAETAVEPMTDNPIPPLVKHADKVLQSSYKA